MIRRLGRQIRARPRLFVSAAFGAAICFLMPDGVDATTATLVAWNGGVALYLALVLGMVGRASAEQVRDHASAQDESRTMILVLTVAAALASLGAIAVDLAGVRDLSPRLQTLHLVLVGVTILISWMFVHLLFALHYAHQYYEEAELRHQERPTGGLDFPGNEDPDYLDFLYFAFVIGTSAQTADVSIVSARMRRTALAHCILAFIFNTVILAITINIAAGLL